MKECKYGKILPYYSDDTHDKVYELNRQMCDLGKTMNDPMKPLSEEVAQECIKALEDFSKSSEEERKACELINLIFEDIEKSILSNDMEEKKTKKMTKAEAFEYLKGKKVYANGKGKEVQTKLFECGVSWPSKCFVYYDFGDYLLIETDGCLYHCGYEGDSYWRLHHFEEISVDDLLSIKIVDENRSEDELVDIVELGKKIQYWLSKLSGHRHVVITETDVLLYDEGMCLFHSDPF